MAKRRRVAVAPLTPAQRKVGLKVVGVFAVVVMAIIAAAILWAIYTAPTELEVGKIGAGTGVTALFFAIVVWVVRRIERQT